ARGLAGPVVNAFTGAAQARIPTADLDERDPDYIRERLPGIWLLASLYFRAEVRGLGNIPEEGGVLLVGNHSGGNLTPDTGVFTLAFSSYFGVERPFYQLAHNLVLSMPGLSFLRKFGTVAAGHAVPAEGAAPVPGAAVGPQRRRHARPLAVARQDHGRGAAAHRPARGVRRRAGPRRGLRPPAAPDAGHAGRAGFGAAAADHR